MSSLKINIFVFLDRFSSILQHLCWLETHTMGVIWNPEKISYLLDTHIMNFCEFQFWGG